MKEKSPQLAFRALPFFPFAFSHILIWFATPPLVRVAATVSALLRQPWTAIQAIPNNWSRVTLAMDSFYSPEAVPNDPAITVNNLTFIATTDKADVVQVFVDPFGNQKFWTPAISRKSGVDRLFALTVTIPIFFLFLFLPVLIYRWSLKATSIIYAPLIFVVHSTFSKGVNLRTKLELIKRSDLSRIRALYGVVAIVAFLVKLVLMIKWEGFVEVWKGNPMVEFLAIYVAPSEIPKWQIAELINSALAVGTMLFARQALLRYDLKHPLPEKPLKHILGFVSGLRWILALYAIICLGYITMREAHNWHWPAIGTKWLPFY
jgi:hypothetical protein